MLQIFFPTFRNHIFVRLLFCIKIVSAITSLWSLNIFPSEQFFKVREHEDAAGKLLLTTYVVWK